MTVAEQHEHVRSNTRGSHVQQFGDASLGKRSIWEFQGGKKSVSNQDMFDMLFKVRFPETDAEPEPQEPVDHEHIIRSEDAKLEYLYHMTIQNADTKANLDFMAELNHRLRVDNEFKHFQRGLRLDNVDYDHINFDCMREIIQEYQKECAAFDEYAMTKAYIIAKACNTDFQMDYIKKVLDESCAH
jgi:hypothetical protein